MQKKNPKRRSKAQRARVSALKRRAAKIFSSAKNGSTWVNTPNPGLNGARPIDLLADEMGAKEVEMALWRVADSLPA